MEKARQSFYRRSTIAKSRHAPAVCSHSLDRLLSPQYNELPLHTVCTSARATIASATQRFGTRGLRRCAMQTIERTTQRRFRYEELNRARQEIQTKWTEAERSH